MKIDHQEKTSGHSLALTILLEEEGMVIEEEMVVLLDRTEEGEGDCLLERNRMVTMRRLGEMLEGELLHMCLHERAIHWLVDNKVTLKFERSLTLSTPTHFRE